MTTTVPGPADGVDTDRWSHYVGLDFYRRLDELVQMWSQDWPPADAMVRLETEGVLAREARLVDDGLFNEWVQLFTDECGLERTGRRRSCFHRGRACGGDRL